MGGLVFLTNFWLKCKYFSISFTPLSCFPRSFFVRFDNHGDAAQAIVAKHGSSLEGYTVKCSWGKEGAAMPGSNMGSAFSNGVSGCDLVLGWVGVIQCWGWVGVIQCWGEWVWFSVGVGGCDSVLGWVWQNSIIVEQCSINGKLWN